MGEGEKQHNTCPVVASTHAHARIGQKILPHVEIPKGGGHSSLSPSVGVCVCVRVGVHC